MKSYAIDNGCNSIELSVWHYNNGAVEFYQTMGLEPRVYVMEYKL